MQKRMKQKGRLTLTVLLSIILLITVLLTFPKGTIMPNGGTGTSRQLVRSSRRRYDYQNLMELETKLENNATEHQKVDSMKDCSVGFTNDSMCSSDYLADSGLQSNMTEYDLRLDRIREVCHNKYPRGNFPGIDKDQLTHMIVVEKYKLLFCWIPKIACTNWKRIFFLTDHNGTEDVLHIKQIAVHLDKSYKPNLLLGYSKQRQQEIIDSYYKFMFVRHPFDRLFSAYHDKFVVGDVHFNIVRRRIIEKVRKVTYTADVENPTFEEFLKYVLTGNYNEHWQLYEKLCNPCRILYDFVGKYENMDQDVEHLKEKLTFTELDKFPKRYESSKRKKNFEHYYKNVSMRTVEKIHEMFKMDIDLYDYKSVYQNEDLA